MKNIKTFADFKDELTSNPGLQKEFKEDPIKAVEQFQTLLPDTLVYRLVVGALGSSILLVIMGIIILSSLGKTIEPTVTTLFTAIASGAVGALAGLLAPSPRAS